MVKQLENFTEKELWSLRYNISRNAAFELHIQQNIGELKEIEAELTRRDKLDSEEVGFELADECCDQCKWVSQIEKD